MFGLFPSHPTSHIFLSKNLKLTKQKIVEWIPMTVDSPIFNILHVLSPDKDIYGELFE